MGEDTWNHCAQVNRSGNLNWICMAHRKYKIKIKMYFIHPHREVEYRIKEGKTLNYKASKRKQPTFKCIDICSHFDQLVLWTLYICSFSQPDWQQWPALFLLPMDHKGSCTSEEVNEIVCMTEPCYVHPLWWQMSLPGKEGSSSFD